MGFLELRRQCGVSHARYDQELREPLVWCQGSQVSIRVVRGRTSLPSSHGSGIRAQHPRIFQTDLGSLDLSFREDMMKHMFGCWFAFPCVRRENKGKQIFKGEMESVGLKVWARQTRDRRGLQEQLPSTHGDLLPPDPVCQRSQITHTFSPNVWV